MIKLAPTDARGWRNRGMIRLYKGDNKGGLADYETVLGLVVGNDVVHAIQFPKLVARVFSAGLVPMQ